MAADEITILLTTIYSQVPESNEWPRDWKRGEWTQVYKVDDPFDKVNYRPVTLLTSVDKVFEQVLCRQLKEMSESILDVFMSAYRSKYSCETTLIKLVGCWKWALDLNKAVGPLSIDMSKVFDSIHC